MLYSMYLIFNNLFLKFELVNKRNKNYKEANYY